MHGKARLATIAVQKLNHCVSAAGRHISALFVKRNSLAFALDTYGPAAHYSFITRGELLRLATTLNKLLNSQILEVRPESRCLARFFLYAVFCGLAT